MYEWYSALRQKSSISIFIKPQNKQRGELGENEWKTFLPYTHLKLWNISSRVESLILENWQFMSMEFTLSPCLNMSLVFNTLSFH